VIVKVIVAFSLFSSLVLAEPAVHVRRTSKVETSKSVLLKDIAEITDLDDNATLEVGKIEILELPNNATRNLTGFQITKILRRYLPAIEERLGSKIQTIVPPMVRIQNRIFKLDIETVTQKIDGEFKKLCADCEFKISNLMVPELANVNAGANWSLEYQGAKLPRGNFSVPLRIESKTVWITGNVRVMRQVPVAVRNLNIGERITEADFKSDLKDVTMANDGFPDATKLIGRQVGRGVSVNEPITFANLAREYHVKFGQAVKILSENEWLQISMNGIAQEKGEIGDRIRVQNPSTKSILSAVVEAPGVVRIQ
jgi:flagella basal body P-ring formation protein FlgA